MGKQIKNKEFKTFHSINEVKQEFFPESILEYLGEHLCSKLGHNTKRYKLNIDKRNHKLGSIVVPFPKFDIFGSEGVRMIIKDFYEDWRYNVEDRGDLSGISARKDKENYWISVLTNPESKYYLVNISENMFKKLKEFKVKF